MVYIVKKKIGNYEYLYLQKSYHIKGGGGKKKTEYYAYLGRADKYFKEDINKILYLANHSKRREIIRLIKQHKKQSKTG